MGSTPLGGCRARPSLAARPLSVFNAPPQALLARISVPIIRPLAARRDATVAKPQEPASERQSTIMPVAYIRGVTPSLNFGAHRRERPVPVSTYLAELNEANLRSISAPPSGLRNSAATPGGIFSNKAND